MDGWMEKHVITFLIHIASFCRYYNYFGAEIYNYLSHWLYRCSDSFSGSSSCARILDYLTISPPKLKSNVCCINNSTLFSHCLVKKIICKYFKDGCELPADKQIMTWAQGHFLKISCCSISVCGQGVSINVYDSLITMEIYLHPLLRVVI